MLSSLLVAFCHDCYIQTLLLSSLSLSSLVSLRQMRSRNKTTERVQTISAGEKSSDPHIMEQLLLMRKLKTIANIALIW